MRPTLISLTVFASTVLLMASTVSAAPLSVEELSQMNFFKNKGITILGTAEANKDLTLVSISAQTPQGVQRMTAFVTNDKKDIIVGSGFNDQSGEQLTIPMDMSKIKNDAGFVLGKGKNELFVFTDPECPFCKRMDQEVLSKLSLDEYTVYVYLFPLSFHQHAEAMSLYILSKKTVEEKVKALHAISGGSMDFANASYTEAERTKLKASLSKQLEVAQSLGVAGTPSLFDSKGTPVNWTTLAPKAQPQK
jgi:thiol:disulfide interchange protein DsbC